MLIGVGTGSTSNQFIDALASIKNEIKATVASSVASQQRLENHGIKVIELNQAGNLDLYVDGADSVDKNLNLIKGGGGALTREKVVAAASDKFICIVDSSKQTDILGDFALPIEVIPMAQSFVARQMVKLGGKPELRVGFKTDNGNIVLDIHGMQIAQPLALEQTINNIPGVVCCGIFAQQAPQLLIVGTKDGHQLVNNPLALGAQN